MFGLLLVHPWCGFNTEETETLGGSISEQECFDAMGDEWESQAFHIDKSRGRLREREGPQPQSELQETGSQTGDTTCNEVT